jgi:GNAT superfamily N-acetyltransferase
MDVRPAAYHDIPSLRWLFGQFIADQAATFAPAYPRFDAEELDNFTLLCARCLGQDPTFFVYLATEDDGSPLGFLGGEIQRRALWKPHVFGSPHWLYVVQSGRHRGVARALVAAGIAELQEQGIEDVELAALPGDPQWQQRGWEPYLVRYHAPTAAIAEIVMPARPTPAVQVAPAAPRPRRKPPTRRRRRKRKQPRTRPAHVNGPDPVVSEV